MSRVRKGMAIPAVAAVTVVAVVAAIWHHDHSVGPQDATLSAESDRSLDVVAQVEDPAVVRRAQADELELIAGEETSSAVDLGPLSTGPIEAADAFFAANPSTALSASRSGDRNAATLLGRLSAACMTNRSLKSCKDLFTSATPGERTEWAFEAAKASDRGAQVYFHDIAMGEIREGDPNYGRKLKEINEKSVRFLESAASAGDSVAMLKLYNFYKSGIQVPRSVEKAYLYGLAGSWALPHRRSLSAAQVEVALPELAQLRREIPDQNHVPALQQLAYRIRG